MWFVTQALLEFIPTAAHAHCPIQNPAQQTPPPRGGAAWRCRCRCRRYLPLLRPQMVPYQLHLYAERVETGEQRVAELIMQ